MIKLPQLNPDKTKDKITNFIKNVKNESNAEGIAIGLSGGLDSTVVAYLLKEAIGSNNVMGVYMSTSTASKEDKKHSKLIAEILNLRYEEIAIDNLSNDFINLAKNSQWIGENDSSEKTAEGNLKARIRMSILYYYANLNNFLVAGTSNRSELLIGYFTKYGDGACDILPIANIYKSQLKKLANDWNIPEEIINKPPSAGFYEGQTDEDEIGFSYEILDKLLHSIVDKRLDNDTISKEIKISTAEINKVRDKIDNNKHKLQFPLSP
ncbi:MAG: NAD+ synthase [Methanobrevibacter sp.]|nr:NAD+ synthase [Methanobrevibacter sp.]